MAPRKTGLGAFGAPAQAAASERGEDCGFIAADPVDARLKAAGAVCGRDGKVDIEAYEDIMQCWAGEPPPEKHPDPTQPGVRSGEEVPNGLRIWDDVRDGCAAKKTLGGAGWVAEKILPTGRKMSKSFNIRTCGSWRLAFLLARLQQNVWENQDLPPRRVPLHLLRSPDVKKRLLRRQSSAESSSGKRLLRRRSSLEASPTSGIKKLRRRTSEEESEKEMRRLKRQSSADDELGPGYKKVSKLNKVLDRIRSKIGAPEESSAIAKEVA